MPSKQDVESLQASLAAAEQELEERSGAGTASSEPREDVAQARQIQEELERRSTASLSEGSGGTMNSVPGQSRQEPPEPAPQSPHLPQVKSQRSSGHSGSGSHSGSGAPSSGSLQQLLARQNQGKVPNDSEISSGSMGPSSGPGPSSGSVGPSATTSDSLLFDTFTNLQSHALQRIVSDILAKNNVEVANLQDKLDGSEDNRRDLAGQISVLQKHLRSNAGMQEVIDAARQRTLDAQDERDDLKDVIAGMEARQEVHLNRLIADLAKLKLDNSEWDEQKLESRKAEVDKSKAELLSELEQNASAILKNKADNEELLKLRQESEADDLAALNQIKNLKNLIATANRDIARRDREESTLPGQKQSAALDKEATDNLQELLSGAQDYSRDLNSELVEVRLAMFNMNRGNEQEIANMQTQLDDLNLKATRPQSLKHGNLPLPRGKVIHGRKHDITSLGKIDEEDGDDGMDIISISHSAISGQVSSDGVNGLADLKDFDEDDDQPIKDTSATDALYARIDMLKNELKEVEGVHAELQDDMAEKEALNASKVKRIMKNLHDSQASERWLEDEINAMKRKGVEDGLENNAELNEIYRLIAASQAARELDAQEHCQQTSNQDSANSQELEAVKTQLLHAERMKRIEEERLHAAKLELANRELKHAQIVADLHTKIQAFEQQDRERGPDSPSYSEDADKLSDTVKRLQEAEQEVNMLKNDLEWKEVSWKSQLENIQQPHEVDRAKLKRVEEDLAAQQELNRQVQNSVTELDEKHQALLSSSRADQIPIMPKPQAPARRSMFAFLRCPARSQGPRASSLVSSISCQNACWQILLHQPGIVALNCSAASLEILEASKSAYVVWGCHTLHGSSLLDLSEKSMRAWLQKRLEPNTSRAAGASTPGSSNFHLWQLPCVSFRDQTGVTFDSSVVCASLPAEPRHARCSAIIVIVDVMEAKLGEPSRPRHVGPSIGPSEGTSASSNRGAQQRRRNRGTPSGISINSDDVTANDSISCVLAEQQQQQ